MPDKIIKAKSKAAFQSFTNIWEMNARCWKSQRPNKKETTFKPHKEKKAKLADSQPTTLIGTNT